LALLAALTTLNIWSTAAVDGGTAGADSTTSARLLPIRPCSDLTSEHPVSPTGVRVRLFSTRPSNLSGAEYCHVIGEIGVGFYFDLRMPRSTYQGQYVRLGRTRLKPARRAVERARGRLLTQKMMLVIIAS
jgi:hypothetical protein